MPIAAGLATTMQVHPLYLMLPVALNASFAFMLPVATPPNALAFGSVAEMKVIEMVRAGLVANCAGVLLVVVWVNTAGRAAFGLGACPEWATATGDSAVEVEGAMGGPGGGRGGRF